MLQTLAMGKRWRDVYAATSPETAKSNRIARNALHPAKADPPSRLLNTPLHLLDPKTKLHMDIAFEQRLARLV